MSVLEVRFNEKSNNRATSPPVGVGPSICSSAVAELPGTRLPSWGKTEVGTGDGRNGGACIGNPKKEWLTFSYHIQSLD